jgi:hypothetical protein
MDSKRKIWQQPWQYKEGFLIALGLVITGFFIEFFSGGRGVPLPRFPFNVILFIELVVFIPVIYFFRKKHNVIRWISSVPAAISSIVLMTLLVLLMGFIPQVDRNSVLTRLGFTHLFQSWPYFFITLYLIIVLGFTISRRIFPFRFKNTGFFLNHAGLWLVVVAASLGAGDRSRMAMYCYKDYPSWKAFDTYGKNQEMPFALELQNFTIEEYEPTLVMADIGTEKIVSENKTPFLLKEKASGSIDNWNISVDEFFLYSVKERGEYRPMKMFGSAASAKISCTNKVTGEKREGWVSCGSENVEPALLPAGKNRAFAMTIPSPKRYKSDLKLYTPDKKMRDISIEVNKPVEINGWKLYQLGYDEKAGRWSNLSIIEAVRDPWLPVVYAGIFMLIAGAVFLFWRGKAVSRE